MHPLIVLGANSILAFGIEMSVGGRQVTKIQPNKRPVILKKPAKGLNLLSYSPFKNPVNLNFANQNDERVDIRAIPMAELLDNIDGVMYDNDDSSNEEEMRRPQPNRRVVVLKPGNKPVNFCYQ